VITRTCPDRVPIPSGEPLPVAGAGRSLTGYLEMLAEADRVMTWSMKP
jgi:hypothetical protein